MTTPTLARTRFPSAVLVAAGLAAGFGVAQGTGVRALGGAVFAVAGLARGESGHDRGRRPHLRGGRPPADGGRGALSA